jgi:hypothetical protein
VVSVARLAGAAEANGGEPADDDAAEVDGGTPSADDAGTDE